MLTVAYPVENIHEAGILRTTFVPAAIARLAERAQDTAIAAIEALNGVGVFCVELFVMRDGSLVINEIAPRPHNSGHYTLDACTVSQFEQQVRGALWAAAGRSANVIPCGHGECHRRRHEACPKGRSSHDTSEGTGGEAPCLRETINPRGTKDGARDFFGWSS